MTGPFDTTTDGQLPDRDLADRPPSTGWRGVYAALSAPAPDGVAPDLEVAP